MGKTEQFEDLPIWQNAADVAIAIYKLTDQGKLKSDFSVKDQIRRSAISVSSNIAEGFEYGNNKEFVRFLKYAKGSAGELRSQLYILYQTGNLPSEVYADFKVKVVEISRQLSGFMKYLKESGR